MKKVLLIVALLTISLTLTFGQATVSGWGRGIFAIFVADGDPTAVSAVSWGPGGHRLGFTISGSSDNVGAQVDVNYDGGNVAGGDQTKIWVKPVEMLTISAGRAFDDTLRGNAGFCANNWYRYDFGIAGDDFVFERVGQGGVPANLIVAVAPVDGAYAYLGFGGAGIDLQGWMWAGEPAEPVLETMFKTGQYGAGYDIAGIGMIRAQYIGKGEYGIINAAFKLTMVEGLMVDIGGFIPTDSDLEGNLAKIALYGNYTMNTLTLHLAGNLTLPLEGGDLGYGAGLGVEYGVESVGGLTIQGDVRYDSLEVFGVGAFAKFSYSNGVFGIGAQVTNSSFADWTDPAVLVDKTDPDAIVFALPIRLEYWF